MPQYRCLLERALRKEYSAERVCYNNTIAGYWLRHMPVIPEKAGLFPAPVFRFRPGLEFRILCPEGNVISLNILRKFSSPNLAYVCA